MKFFTSDASFNFTWEEVVSAFWQRYPNPQSKHVLSEDVLERRIIDGKLFTKRLISKTNSLPRWGERFVGGLGRNVYIVEESIVDQKTRTFITYTRNIGLQKIMSIDERCVYSQHPDSTDATQLMRQAWVNSGVYGFSSVISSFGASRFKKNASKSITGFEYVLKKLYVTETPVLDSAKDNKDGTRSMKDKAKDYAKLKAKSVKSKVPRHMTTSCDES